MPKKVLINIDPIKCDKVADFYLITLFDKFISDWLVTNKMFEKLDNSVVSNVDIFFDDVDSNIVTFLSDNMGVNTIDINNINVDDDTLDKDDPETINNCRIITWFNRLKRRKPCKK